MKVKTSFSARNGICPKKNPDGTRIHKLKNRIDMYGNEYQSCERCGNIDV